MNMKRLTISTVIQKKSVQYTLRIYTKNKATITYPEIENKQVQYYRKSITNDSNIKTLERFFRIQSLVIEDTVTLQDVIERL